MTSKLHKAIRSIFRVAHCQRRKKLGEVLQQKLRSLGPTIAGTSGPLKVTRKEAGVIKLIKK